MKVISERSWGGAPQLFEAELERRVGNLFRRHPALYTFSLDARWIPGDVDLFLEREIVLRDVGAYPALSGREVTALCEEIVDEARKFILRHPDAAELLQNRTFARTFS